MPWGSVMLDGPPGREVYLNGNYAEAAGRTGDVIAVAYGRNSLETLDSLFRVDLAAMVEVGDQSASATAALAPVIPPRSTALTPEDAIAWP